MPLNPVAQIDISLQTTTVSRQGFGTPLFFTSTYAFPERVRAYSSLSEIAGDFPTTSEAYKAGIAFFANTPRGSTLKVARIGADLNIAPTEVSEGTVTSFKLKTFTGYEATFSYTALVSDAADDICSALQSLVMGDSEVSPSVTANVLGTGADAVLEIGLTNVNAPITISEQVNVTETYTNKETAAVAYEAAMLEDDDKYFLTAEFDDTFRVALKTIAEANTVLYGYSVKDTSYMDAASSTTPTGDRTFVLFHDQAQDYPELQWIGHNAPYAPDETSVTWAGNKLSLFAESRNPSTGNKLTTTQVNNILSYGFNIVSLVGGVPVTRVGKLLGGEWIDTIHGRDTMDARVEESVSTLIINQHGGKIPFTAEGIGQIDAAVMSALQPFVDSGFLESFVTKPPLMSSISAADKQSRQLKGYEFIGYLAGAIHEFKAGGVLTISEQ